MNAIISTAAIPQDWMPLRPHKIQSALWRTDAQFNAVWAGRGSGKTELARRYVIRWLPIRKEWSDPDYFYALPTYKQAKRVAWRRIKKLVPREWIHKINETELTIETIFGSTLWVLGMDQAQRAEGTQWDGGVVDESCDQKPGIFDITLFPALTHRNGWCWRIGVPKRQGQGAAEFKEYCLSAQKGEIPNTRAFTWSAEDILPPSVIATARKTLSEKDFNEQFRARWETASGLVFYAFDWTCCNTHHTVYNPTHPLTVGTDFNVDPMAWVITQRYPNKLVVLDELWLRNTNTPEALNTLWQKYGKQHKAGWEFVGDATSRARKTAATTTDYLIIKGDTRFQPARIDFPRSNPPLVSRFAATNAMLKNAAGECRCHIHPRCVNLIKDLETRAYKIGNREPDDYDDVGHATDALGYIIARFFPISIQVGTPKISMETMR